MARQSASMKKARNRYSQSYKDEASALADRIGISASARELGVQPSQLYQWRAKSQQKQSVSVREKALADEYVRLKRQLAKKSDELDIAKIRGVLCQKPEVKYAFIQQYRQAFSIQRMCAILCVARSGYYAWRRHSGKLCQRQRQQSVIDQRVAQAYHHRKGRSGAPRLTLDLCDEGLSINRKTVAASLHWQGLRAKAARKCKATTNSRHALPVASNLLKQNFTAKVPNQKWVGDITYLVTVEGWDRSVLAQSHRLGDE